MNRPEPIELENNLGPDAVTGEINRVPWMAYDVDEMDQYIAAKDAEIESLKASHYAEMVDAGMRERRLRRALWLARAMRAEAQWNRQVSNETWILILCFLLLIGMSITEIRNKEARAEVKAALELVEKANALCKEAK